MPTPVYSVYNSYQSTSTSCFEKLLDKCSLPLRRFRGGIDVQPRTDPKNKADPSFMTDSKIYTRIIVGLVISPLLAVNAVVLAIKYVWTVLLTSRSKQITKIMQETTELKETFKPQHREDFANNQSMANAPKETDIAAITTQCNQVLDQPKLLEDKDVEKGFYGMLVKLSIQESFDITLFKRLDPSQRINFYKEFFEEFISSRSPITLFNFSPTKFLDNILSIFMDSDKDQNTKNKDIENEINTIIKNFRKPVIILYEKKLIKYFLASVLYRKALELIESNYTDPSDKQSKIVALKSNIDALDSIFKYKLCNADEKLSNEHYDLIVTWMKSINDLCALEKKIQTECNSNKFEDAIDDLNSALETSRQYVEKTSLYENLKAFSTEFAEYKKNKNSKENSTLPTLNQVDGIDISSNNILTPQTNYSIAFDYSDKLLNPVTEAHYSILTQIYLDIHFALEALKAQPKELKD